MIRKTICSYCYRNARGSECYECGAFVCEDDFCQAEHDTDCPESDVWGD